MMDDPAITTSIPDADATTLAVVPDTESDPPAPADPSTQLDADTKAQAPEETPLAAQAAAAAAAAARKPLTLLELPNDILQLIIKKIVRSNDLTALARTCSTLYSLSVPFLYASFDIVWLESQQGESEGKAVNALTYGLSTLCLGSAFARTTHQLRASLRRRGPASVEGVVQTSDYAKYVRKFSLGNGARDGIAALGLESCVTLGMLDDVQAKELKEAGLTAYNHNVDTSREHYPNVITTRSYDERLQTISNVRNAGIKVCTGGILGLGESPEDHVGLLHTVSTMPAHPESFPVNTLVPIEGTPLFKTACIKFDAVLRTIATARMIMPTAIIRLAAGRVDMTEEKQALCFMAGANAVFTGEKMLTTACSSWEEDQAMFKRWGLFPMKAYVEPKLRDGSDTADTETTETKIKDAAMPSVSVGQPATI